VLGYPTGHPFINVDGNNPKARQWLESERADAAAPAFKDRRQVESTPDGDPVPTPRGSCWIASEPVW
jgi:hypothetical protein